VLRRCGGRCRGGVRGGRLVGASLGAGFVRAVQNTLLCRTQLGSVILLGVFGSLYVLRFTLPSQICDRIQAVLWAVCLTVCVERSFSSYIVC
jgi:hypothetical protein